MYDLIQEKPPLDFNISNMLTYFQLLNCMMVVTNNELKCSLITAIHSHAVEHLKDISLIFLKNAVNIFLLVLDD